eukprot:TRINITY_DN836_c1_g2_i1.p1 TRINITY_DN836_c1_g2~~TRINITY_DN836_c1_g2_i1.p1  ORF type:complete len:134 (+),score=49.56 TRINITY_DN836_c1_g2_i1:79-480(+)
MLYEEGLDRLPCPQTQEECKEGFKLYASVAAGGAALVGLQLFLASPIKSNVAFLSHTTAGLLPIVLLVWITLFTQLPVKGDDDVHVEHEVQVIVDEPPPLMVGTGAQVRSSSASGGGAHLRSASAKQAVEADA